MQLNLLWKNELINNLINTFMIKKIIFYFVLIYLSYEIYNNFNFNQTFNLKHKELNSKSKKAFITQFKEDELIISTFNVEWLGDGLNDRKERSENDYKLIAKVISELNSDIVALQEIENKIALKRILKYLTDYKFVISENKSAQNIAYLYNTKIKITRNYIYDKVDFADRSTRPALVLVAKKNNFDFVISNVHFKSTSRFDNTKEKKERSISIRTEQADKMSLFVDSIINKGKEKDIIIVGDFNDSPIRKKNPSLLSLIYNKNGEFLTSELKSCKNKTLYSIDHIFVSKSVINRFITTSERSYNFNLIYEKEISNNISDHCPVSANFDCKRKDND